MQSSSRTLFFKQNLAGASPITDANVGSRPVVRVAQLDQSAITKVEAAGASPAALTNLTAQSDNSNPSGCYPDYVGAIPA